MLLSACFSSFVVFQLPPRQAPKSCHLLISSYRKRRARPFLLASMAALLFLPTSIALAVAIGDKAPDCKLSSLGDSQSSTLSQYPGKVLYVDFWASWCGPCAKSFPFMNELHSQLKDQGLQIVAVNLDEKPEEAQAFLSQYPAQFTVAADASKQCAKDFGVKAMPSSYLIDRKGKVHHIHLGFRPGEAKDLRQVVEQLLNEKVAE